MSFEDKPQRDWRVELRRLERLTVALNIEMGRLLAHYGLPEVTEAEIDAEMERQEQEYRARRRRQSS